MKRRSLKLVSKQAATGQCPGLVITALRGGSGKTIFSVGIIAALRNRGLTVAPFKKGPDYIDAGWLALAAGRPCYNLDTFLVEPSEIAKSYTLHTRDANAAIVEGNRGVYDAINIAGRTSTAELAKLIDLPVLLCVDGTKTTRTMAAVVAGCLQFDVDLKIKGVILNHVAGARHEKILRDSIEQYCRIPVLGAVPKLGRQSFPERHMGLVPTYEHQWAQDAVGNIAELAEQYLDLKAIADLAGIQFTGRETVLSREHPTEVRMSALAPATIKGKTKPRIGIVRDTAFQFYYPENLEALVQADAELIVTSPLYEDSLPAVDALYIGGGFPETHAARLAKNFPYREQIKAAADDGMPIYAECGGLMYLGEALEMEGTNYPMAGVLPVRFGFSRRPQGHGYAVFHVARVNPYFQIGQTIRSHEFHYSTIQAHSISAENMAFDLERGTGLLEGRDGLCYNNVLATYMHIHALGTPQWAAALVDLARKHAKRK